MAYIGDYMRGASADTGMPSIIGLQQYIQQGFDAGRAQGQNQQLAQLAQSAYNDTGAQQSQDVRRAIGINPQAGLALGNAVGAQTAQQRQTATLQKLGKVASAIVAAKQRGDETTAEGLYQAALPELRMFASQRGAPPPPNSVDGSDMGAMYKLAVMFGNGLPAAQKYAVAAPGSAIFDPATGAVKTSVPNRGQVVGGYYFDPNTGTASPIPINGAQNGAAVAAPVPGNPQGAAPQATGAPNIGQPAPASVVEGNVPAGTQVTQATGPDGARVAFAFAPGTTDAVKSQAGAVAGIPQSAPSTSTLAGALQSKGQVHTLTPAEVKAAGLPEGTVAQMAPNGQINVISKPNSSNSDVLAAPPADPSLQGQAYIAALPDTIRANAVLLAEGKAPWPTGYVLRTAYGQQLVDAARHINPHVDATSFPSRLAVSKSVAAGPLGNSMNAFSTALQHANALIEANQAMDVSNIPGVGSVDAQKLSLERNNAYNAFLAGRMPFASEMARAYKGGAPAEGEIEQYYKMLDPAAGQKAIAQRLQTYTDFLYSKALANARQYQQGMRDAGVPYAPLPPEALDAIKQSREIALKAGVPQQKLDQEAEKAGVNTIAAAPPSSVPTQPPAAAIQMLRSNPALAPQFDAKYGPGTSQQYIGH